MSSAPELSWSRSWSWSWGLGWVMDAKREALKPGCHLRRALSLLHFACVLRKALHTFKRALLSLYKAPALAVRLAVWMEAEANCLRAFELISATNKSSRKCRHSLSHSLAHPHLARLCLLQFFIKFMPDHGKSIKLLECNGNRIAEHPHTHTPTLLVLRVFHFLLIVISLSFPFLSFRIVSFIYFSLNAHSCLPIKREICAERNF